MEFCNGWILRSHSIKSALILKIKKCFTLSSFLDFQCIYSYTRVFYGMLIYFFVYNSTNSTSVNIFAMKLKWRKKKRILTQNIWYAWYWNHISLFSTYNYYMYYKWEYWLNILVGVFQILTTATAIPYIVN